MTGGTGFLGRHLVERLLAQGRRVTVLARRPAPDLVRQGAQFIGASLDDPDAVRAACRGVETVFHVAAKVGVWGRYADFHVTNVLGTEAIIEGCKRHGVARLVYTSTPSVVYNGRDLAGADESLPLTTHCPSPYPLTKAIAERSVLEANSSALRTVALRPHLVWGAGDPHLVPRIAARRDPAACASSAPAATASILRMSPTRSTPTSWLSLRSASSRNLRPPPAGRTSSPMASRSCSGTGSTTCCVLSGFPR